MTLDPVIQILIGFLIVSTIMAGLWLVQRKTGNAGIVDAGWAAALAGSCFSFSRAKPYSRSFSRCPFWL
jgi:steroid 5-alpha reductase family enzyme